MDKARMKKIGDIAANVVLYVFLVLCIFIVFITVTSKRDQTGASTIFGYQMRVVDTNSMEKCELTNTDSFEIKDIPVNSMVFVKVMPTDPAAVTEWYRSLKEGDVLTFRYVYASQVTITHRIIHIEEKETGGFLIELAGDNKNSEDGQDTQIIDTSIPNNTNYVIGKVTGQAYIFGLIMSFIMKPLGMVMLVILPCFVIIMLEVSKIIKVLGADKRKREQEEKEQKENELADLRRRLAELEKQKNALIEEDKIE